MDYLDHSMHIAEYDWTSFYEDCEECCVLQPLLAYHDSSSLSESEDSESSVFSTSQQEPQPSSAANWDDSESSAAGCCMEEENCTGQDDLTTKAKLCLNHPEGTPIPTAEHNTEKTNDPISDTPQTEQLNVQSSDRDVKMKSDIRELKSTQESDPLPCSRTELNVNEPHTTDITVTEDVSGGAFRAEKERWFVTVNDGPARQQVCAASVKRKRRQKKTRKGDHMWRPGQEKSLKSSLKFEIMKDKNESEGGAYTEHVTQANQNLVQKSGGYLSAEEDPENFQMGVISDLSPVPSGKEDNLSKELVMSHPTKDNNIEPTIDRTSQNTSTSASTPNKDLLRFDIVESDELEDDVKFFFAHRFDSESYLSATESVEEFQHLLMEHQQLHSSSSLTENSYLFNLTENTKADNTQDREVDSCANTLSCNVIVTNAKGHESADVQPTLTFPSAGQSADKMPDDNSTCDNDTHSTLPPNTPGLQKHEVKLSASGCSSGDQLLPVPDLTVTLCSVADSPETYAEAAGHTRPVYAISAFWDEMEKLTIHEILQLRMGRSTPPRETQETVTPSVDDLSCLINSAEYNLLDGGLMDTSDTADSDYFTQPDESKPDRSSCEFSTSDFEEEYSQFLGASKNPSPDLQSKNQQSTSDSPFLVHEEDDSTGSEGKETHVPLKDSASECFEDQDSNAFISSKLAWPRQITKSKSMHNVQALNTEDSSLQLLLGNDESCLFLSSCPSMEENVVINTSDIDGTLIPAPFLDEHYQVSFPEVFEYLLRENKAKRDLQCITFYDPEDISVAPVFDYNLCKFRDEMSFFSLHDYQRSDERPIPIFSCPHPTVRELTFPHQNYVFLSADCEEEDDISPIRVVSRSFILGSDCGAAATHGFYSWKSLIRKIHFPDKGSIWCRRSGALVFPVEAEKITMKSANPTITVLTERRVTSTPSQLFRELTVQQRLLEGIRTTRREGIFSTLKQSDMCLVCIAFASWVLKSSDPETADAWKAALLANVSALSAIQYLRQYVRKKNPS
ncbi:serine-rich adhesin for platelets isoform X2 [Etheostoma cragini]|uniref:serine-rich adhesin for platelets isoform X2 n=1 Tax=Etheostoma cragini TaxID=417921 RepID=UPI00155EAED6|nr:serine-rich adhesin for platelets isoform X2 [Etheostoma cragini]